MKGASHSSIKSHQQVLFVSQKSNYSPKNHHVSGIIPWTQTTTSLSNKRLGSPEIFHSLPPKVRSIAKSIGARSNAKAKPDSLLQSLEGVLPFHVSNVQQKPWLTFPCNHDWFIRILVSCLINPESGSTIPQIQQISKVSALLMWIIYWKGMPLHSCFWKTKLQ